MYVALSNESKKKLGGEGGGAFFHGIRPVSDLNQKVEFVKFVCCLAYIMSAIVNGSKTSEPNCAQPSTASCMVIMLSLNVNISVLYG